MSEASIIYFSASGNTAKVAGWIADELITKGLKVNSFKIFDIMNSIPEEIANSDIIFIGTPTYMWHTPQIVKDFLKSVSTFNRKPVCIFVTYGKVTVGSNLSYLLRIINKKSGKIVGAMQLEAEHSMMFKSDSPLANGKPDENDKELVMKFVSQCLERSGSTLGEKIKIPGVIKYFAFLSSPKITKKLMPQLKYDNKECNVCGICVENCPTHNIKIVDEKVIHGDNCLLCYNCVRECPAGAIDANLKSMDAVLRILSHLLGKGSSVL